MSIITRKDMFDLQKILEIVDDGKEVFLARENKSFSVIMSFEKYQELLNKKSEKTDKDTSNLIPDSEDYATLVKKSLIEDYDLHFYKKSDTINSHF